MEAKGALNGGSVEVGLIENGFAFSEAEGWTAGAKDPFWGNVVTEFG